VPGAHPFSRTLRNAWESTNPCRSAAAKMVNPGRVFPGRGCRYSAKGPISRILSCAVIPLGAALPRTLISDLPGGFGNCIEPPGRIGPMRNAAWLEQALPSLFGLAPCGVYLDPGPYRRERCALTAPFHPYPSGSPGRKSEPFRRLRMPKARKQRGSRGGIFSVALAVHEP